MDKPINMPVKEYLMRVMSLRANIPLKVIETVVEHQFSSAHEAMKNHKSLEISGFCKFIYNQKKAEKILEKNYSKKKTFEEILQRDLTEAKRKSVELKLANTIKYIEDEEPRVYGHIKSMGGLEKQADTSRGDEGSNSTDSQLQTGDL